MISLRSFSFLLRFIGLLWLIQVVSYAFFLDLSGFGIFPRTFFGLIGIATSPLIHGDFVHLLYNTIPLLTLGIALFWLYPGIAQPVFFICYFLTGFLVWLLGRPYLHVGASGLLYGIAAFLMTIGLFQKDGKSIFISIAVALLYSSMIWGVFPNQPGVSWESHLWGAVVGVACASMFSAKRLPQ